MAAESSLYDVYCIPRNEHTLECISTGQFSKLRELGADISDPTSRPGLQPQGSFFIMEWFSPDDIGFNYLRTVEKNMAMKHASPTLKIQFDRHYSSVRNQFKRLPCGCVKSELYSISRHDVGACVDRGDQIQEWSWSDAPRRPPSPKTYRIPRNNRNLKLLREGRFSELMFLGNIDMSARAGGPYFDLVFDIDHIILNYLLPHEQECVPHKTPYFSGEFDKDFDTTPVSVLPCGCVQAEVTTAAGFTHNMVECISKRPKARGWTWAKVGKVKNNQFDASCSGPIPAPAPISSSSSSSSFAIKIQPGIAVPADSEDICRMCYTFAPDVMFSCSHNVLCSACATAWQAKTFEFRCLECQELVTHTITLLACKFSK